MSEQDEKLIKQLERTEADLLRLHAVALAVRDAAQGNLDRVGQMLRDTSHRLARAQASAAKGEKP